MALRISEQIPEEPPECDEEYKRQLWQMVRENCRITKEFEQRAKESRFFLQTLLWFIGTAAALIAFWETFKGGLRKWLF